MGPDLARSLFLFLFGGPWLWCPAPSLSQLLLSSSISLRSSSSRPWPTLAVFAPSARPSSPRALKGPRGSDYLLECDCSSISERRALLARLKVDPPINFCYCKPISTVFLFDFEDFLLTLEGEVCKPSSRVRSLKISARCIFSVVELLRLELELWFKAFWPYAFS